MNKFFIAAMLAATTLNHAPNAQADDNSFLTRLGRNDMPPMSTSDALQRGHAVCQAYTNGTSRADIANNKSSANFAGFTSDQAKTFVTIAIMEICKPW